MNKKDIPKPFLNYPTVCGTEIQISLPASVKCFEFYTISDGLKRVYTNKDALKGYGQQRILDPCSTSFTNLFVNGILQPKASYEVGEGRLVFKTEDLPPAGVSIILQMIVM
ncbi:DUF4183 domain-containing protein [Sporolactobacillus sp. CPB3-1]|uniref:DUF4183 domain-containing protein n=1 Tax=Sporolactobacillus mangiferae TaxID=2940498 RepID=A0ABT0M6U6_9BACL|nr:DUF4183 domain-containing protein [Sporolactobacillus mangiferae]MCL1630575.1 DUF4183 domain-containing protein [Sporolactobacillus mangiferae]